MWLLGDHGRLIKWHPLVKFQFVGMTLKMKFKEQNFTLFAYTNYRTIQGYRRLETLDFKGKGAFEYVFGVYNSLIVAVYKPSEWFVCKEAKDRLPGQDIVFTPKIENRLFFCG